MVRHSGVSFDHLHKFFFYCKGGGGSKTDNKKDIAAVHPRNQYHRAAPSQFRGIVPL